MAVTVCLPVCLSVCVRATVSESWLFSVACYSGAASMQQMEQLMSMHALPPQRPLLQIRANFATRPHICTDETGADKLTVSLLLFITDTDYQQNLSMFFIV